jgi:hypothetical protein
VELLEVNCRLPRTAADVVLVVVVTVRTLPSVYEVALVLDDWMDSVRRRESAAISASEVRLANTLLADRNRASSRCSILVDAESDRMVG